MLFFTADAHFGHANILKLCDRPFDTIEEMNEELIRRGNRKVSGGDTVYILGDLFFRCPDPVPILERLRGRKVLIVGNHDSSWMDKVDLNRYFQEVTDFKVITNGQYAITLCHYPLLTWKHQRKSYMIHGHIHADTTDDFFPLISRRERVLNAGMDINGFEPVTFEELLENNARFKEAYRQQDAAGDSDSETR